MSLRHQVWLIDARTLASRPTGIGMYSYRLIKCLISGQMEKLDGSENRFVIVCDVKESAEIQVLEAAGCEIRVFGKHVFNSISVLRYFLFLKRVIAEVKPDVFWQPNNLQPFRLCGIRRVIVTMHDVFGLQDWTWRYALWHLYYRFSFKRTLRNVTEVWFNSKVTEQQVRTTAPREMMRLVSKITYPITEVPPRKEVAVYHHDNPYFLYVGNIEGRKGADILIEAYQRYREQGGKCDLIFAGLEKNILVPRIAGIEVLGYVDDATKFSLMCSAVALIVPSRAEGYGMQVAEAAALGVKCIASDLPVFGEIADTQRVAFPVGDVGALVQKMQSCL